MSKLRIFVSRLVSLFRQHAEERELEEELEEHLALLIERNIHQGMSAKDAQIAAKRQFGRDSQLKETLREQRNILFFESVLQDVCFAVRQLRKSPAFSVTAVLTLALGIGVNTAVFSIVYAVLLRPLPFTNADRLVMAWEQNPHRGWYHNIVSAANFKDWRKDNDVFSDMALIDPFLTFNLTGSGGPVEIQAERVTPNLFSLLGVQPLMGRTFLREEGHPGSSRAVVLGHALWVSRYGGDRSIVGKQISLNSESYTVVGVMPAGFSDVYSPSLDSTPQVWVSALDLSDPGRDDHNFMAVARLRAGVTLKQAQAEMNGIATRLEKQYPGNRGWGVGLVSLHDETVGNTRPALLILLVAVALVLLIVCVNLANLLLARSAVRLREFAVRRALGANRGRLLSQLLTESLLLSLGGAAAGLGIASLGTKGLIAIAPIDTPGIETAGLHPLILVYTAGIAFATALVFGLLPATRISHFELSGALKESGRSSRKRQALVKFDVCLCLPNLRWPLFLL